jgi:hypothetical protein
VSQGCGFQRPAIESYNHQTVEFKKGEQIFVLLLPTASLFRKARAHTHLTAARTALEVPAVLKYGHGCKASPDARLVFIAPTCEVQKRRQSGLEWRTRVL